MLELPLPLENAPQAKLLPAGVTVAPNPVCASAPVTLPPQTNCADADVGASANARAIRLAKPNARSAQAPADAETEIPSFRGDMMVL